MDPPLPKRKYTDEEKRQLIANLDIEGFYSLLPSKIPLQLSP